MARVCPTAASGNNPGGMGCSGQQKGEMTLAIVSVEIHSVCQAKVAVQQVTFAAGEHPSAFNLVQVETRLIIEQQ